MNYCFILLLSLLASASGFAQATAPALVNAAFNAHMANNFRQAGQLYEQAFALPGAPPSAGQLYNSACSWALAGEPTKAFRNLNRATEAGWDNLTQLKTDPDLASLRPDKRWPQLLKKAEAAVARVEATQNIPLKRELQAMHESDQGPRRVLGPLQQRYPAGAPQLDSLYQQMKLHDTQNEARVKAIIAQYGWPGASLVGRAGSSTAFLVLQHSNLATIQEYLPLIRQAAAKGELGKGELALMEDRVLIFQNKPQVYGSQVRSNAATGKMEFYPIQDEAHVDERRATMELGPLADYARMFNFTYVPAK
ncbi:DUF6624 domain-containing protein [Hymenobacter cheonanensis]|uniref:DUF6624 domain-containing protein n=1 Tax=Hymenobacter sp. CA2-7 TaxID=3063993 RepID=UPI0027129D32|nr:DUF6624 domain-containing protein [Hymenobacter sp. CA2-7]MDO7885792.1 hypothetical protein [Hymenobacter sp. CA2-7]